MLVASLAWAGAGAAESEGFVSLFNGKDLTGWKVPEGDGGHWKVVDGVIDYDAGSEAKGDKALWSEREYGDFVLQIDWRLKEAPFINKNIPYILPDGTHAKDIHGKELRTPAAGRGFRRLSSAATAFSRSTSGAGRSARARSTASAPTRKTPPELRAAATPSTQADKPVGEWNHFEITVKGKTVTVALNGKTVIPGATIPTCPTAGGIAFQHHGGKNKTGEWTGPPSLVQFKNIYIKELTATRRPATTRRRREGAADHRRARPRGCVLLALRRIQGPRLAAGGHQRHRFQERPARQVRRRDHVRFHPRPRRSRQEEPPRLRGERARGSSCCITPC